MYLNSSRTILLLSLLLVSACNGGNEKSDSSPLFGTPPTTGASGGLDTEAQDGEDEEAGDQGGNEDGERQDDSDGASSANSQEAGGADDSNEGLPEEGKQDDEASSEPENGEQEDDSDGEGEGPKFDVAPPEDDGETGDCEDEELVCDGIDDDCNGVIDDVDKEKDGICDCLNVLILGGGGRHASGKFREWLEEQGSLTSQEALDDDTIVDAKLLEPYHILIVDFLPRDLSQDEIDTIFSWVNDDGRGMITMSGYTGAGTGRDRTRPVTEPFGILYRQVPIYTDPAMMNGALEINEGVGDSIIFFGGFPVDTTGDGMALGTSEGDVAGVAQEQGEGRLIVWGDEWISFDSEWSSTPEIPRMWSNWFRWVQPKDFCDVPPPVE